MSYATHLTAVIDALLEAQPGLSARDLASRADVGRDWVANFRRDGVANLAKADAVLDVARDLCPQGPAGDRVRALLAGLDTGLTLDTGVAVDIAAE